MENLHLDLQDYQGQTKPQTPRNRKGVAPEVLHLFLDNSKSMVGSPAVEAEKILWGLGPRLERTPTNVHLVGSNWDAHRSAKQCTSECEIGTSWGDGNSY